MNRLNRLGWVVVAVAAIALAPLTGCSKKSETKRPVTPVQKSSGPINLTEQPTGEQPAPLPAGAAATPTETAPAEVTPPPFKFTESDALTALVNQFRVDQGRFPTDVNEIVKVGMTLKLPAPPAGKQFVIVKVDDRTARVEIR